jgi:glycosyltransferase involved in cell wall biosynthesis
MRTKVIIDPKVNVYYASFYIRGLYEKFGRENIVFKSRPFKMINNRLVNLNFIVIKNNIETKFSINFDDSFEIKEECYNWCDVYGNVNTNWNETSIKCRKKLVSLAPSFGIQLWNFTDTIFYAVSNYIKTGFKSNLRKFVGKYKRQYVKRLPFDDYRKKSTVDNYIFHVSTLWPSNEWVMNDEFVNKARANFIDICKSLPEIHFEGGFYYSGKYPLNERYKNMIFNNFLPINKYIEKLQQSTLVFNTPAWLNCNGWKLGEYMALGKAIISTPLFNDIPAPLIHGEHIHFVENDIEQIKSAILLILHDDAYRHKLEKGSRMYWEQYATPVKSLELLGL